MFDQKWLKRYMLQNRPDGEEGAASALPGKSMASTAPPGKGGVATPQRGAPPVRDLDQASDAGVQRPPPRIQEPPVESVAVYEVTCPRCGHVYKSDAHFCPKCGHKRLEASVVVSRPPAEASSRMQAPTPGRTPYSSEPPWNSYPSGQSRTPPAPSMPPTMSSGYSQSRHYPPPNEFYGGARPSDAPPPSYMPPAPQNALPRSMSMRSEGPAAAPPSPPKLGPGEGGQLPPGGQPWPVLGGGGFFGPYGQFPYDANANMYNMWPTNYGSEGGGLKNFVVLCKDDVEVRASPTYSDDARIGQLLHPGQVVVIDERRMVNGSWFLHLADGRGWIFESKERLLVMTEVQDFERGLWHYSVVCEDDVETRVSPTYSDDARTGIILCSGDTVAIDERCRVAGARFLKLADGRGWVFETRDRLLVFSEVRSKPQEARDFERGLWHYTVVCDDDVEIRAAPTYSDEARTGLMIHPGDTVAIDERCRVAAVWYLRLSDGRGWVFESKDSRRVMMQLH